MFFTQFTKPEMWRVFLALMHLRITLCFFPSNMLPRITCHLQGMDAGFISGAFFSFSRAAASMALTAILRSSPVKQPAQHGFFFSVIPTWSLMDWRRYCSLTLFSVDIFEIVGRKWTGRIPLSHACHSQKDSERLTVMRWHSLLCSLHQWF